MDELVESEIDRLREALEHITRERDDADRRAGAAERQMERLKEHGVTDINIDIRRAFDGNSVPAKNIALRAAADEIDRLREERVRLKAAAHDISVQLDDAADDIDRLREALRCYACKCPAPWDGCDEDREHPGCGHIARAALEGRKDG